MEESLLAFHFSTLKIFTKKYAIIDWENELWRSTLKNIFVMILE